MNIQYIKDETGKTTGVYIPINEWDEIKSTFNHLDEQNKDIPEWQQAEVLHRIENTKESEYKSWAEIRDQLKPGK